MVEAKHRCPFQDGNGDMYLNGDVYFSLILNALNATMPSAYEAALFSVELIFPEQTFEYYSPVAKEEVKKTILRLWGDNGLSIYERMHRRDSYYDNVTTVPQLHTIPVGFHQAWKTRPRDFFSQPQIQAECKFIKFMY
jgi:hypothetical protein